MRRALFLEQVSGSMRKMENADPSAVRVFTR